MRHSLGLALLLCATPLAAQIYLVAGDNSLSLTHLLHDHPEGMVLTLPSATGQSLSQAFSAILDGEPALELQLGTQELERRQPLGRELALLRGWDAEKPHWALVGPGRQVFAEGTEAPTSAQFAELYRRSPLRSRAERLRDFFKENPDHAEAMATLVLELRSLGERRAEKILAQAKPADKAPQPESKGFPKAPAPLLSEADDERIWGEYALRYEQFLRGNLWPGPMPTSSSPLPLAAQISSFAEQSPRLRDLAHRVLPLVEARLQVRLSDERRWKVWLSLRRAGAGGRPSELLTGVMPPPGTRHWPPSAALDAFVEDAQEREDWRDAEAVLQAAYDRNQDLLKALDAAAKEDATGHAPTNLGSYFGFGTWNGEAALLTEAKLRLGKLQEADKIFRETFARAPRPEIAKEAAALAQRCGVDSLAEQWEKLGSRKD